MRNSESPARSTPRSTRARLARLTMSRPDSASSAVASATWLPASDARSRAVARVAVDRPAAAGLLARARMACIAGAIPKRRAVARLTPAVKSRIGAFSEKASISASSTGISPSSSTIVTRATAIDAAPPSSASSADSTNSSRNTAQPDAPTASRTDTSAARSVARAISRLATLAQAMSRTNAVTANRSARMARDSSRLPLWPWLPGSRKTVRARTAARACLGKARPLGGKLEVAHERRERRPEPGLGLRDRQPGLEARRHINPPVAAALRVAPAREARRQPEGNEEALVLERRRAVEPRRRHTHDRHRHVVDDQRVVEDRGTRVEACDPVAVAEDDDVAAAAVTIVVRRQQAAERRPELERREVAARDEQPLGADRLSAVREVGADLAEAAERGEHRLDALEIAEERVVEDVLHVAAVVGGHVARSRPGRRDGDELLRRRYG